MQREECMGKDNNPLLIYTTFENIEDAKSVGRELVQARLAACANIIPSMISIYEWQNDLCESSEVIMLIKTRKACLDKALARVKKLHPYEVPALLVIEPANVDSKFAEWIVEQTQTRY